LSPERPDRPALRSRLSAAACALIASAAATAARADGTTTQIDAAALIYGEQNLTNVVEPVFRITRVRPGGQSFSAEFGLDVITGASPTGASPSGKVQTVTTPSGQTKSTSASEIPTTTFQDFRGSLALDWTRPLGALVVPTLGAHVSREKDYQSLGVSGKLSLDVLHRRTTLTAGGSVDRDNVFPVGGIVEGLSDGVATGETSRDKNVTSVLLGVSQVVTRRWLVGLSATRTDESGYLTEPYKVLSVIDSEGYPISSLRERRPEARRRTSVLASSVYHFGIDVLNASYRAYRDDWGIRSSTVDLKLRHDVGDDQWVEPHVRWYLQHAADFFRFSLNDGAPLPEFASSDTRLGELRTATLGATYGFRLGSRPGELTVRAEYLAQWGDGHPSSAVGVQRTMDLMPLQNIGSLTLGYSVGW
jgi:uncharacterized protein DUF3570